MSDPNMSEQDQWQRNNEAYLAAALDWIRRRLAQLGAGNDLRPAAAAPAPSVGFWRSLFQKTPPPPAEPFPLAAPVPTPPMPK